MVKYQATSRKCNYLWPGEAEAVEIDGKPVKDVVDPVASFIRHSVK